MSNHSSAVMFAAGMAVGSCLALAVARFALSPRRQWSWKEWRAWKALALGISPPPTPTRQAWASTEEVNGTSGPSNFPNGLIEGSTFTPSSSFGRSPSLSSPPLHSTNHSLIAQQDDIIAEQFTRNAQFFGEAGQLAVHSSFVVVVGLGGVGSHAAAMLLRAGVGKLRIVDFDQVSLSSLNRHAVATRADVGTSKAVCLKKHFHRIFPEAEVDARVALFESASEAELLSGNPDFVLDCIDNIDTKVALLAACLRLQLPVVCATGAGARVDPTRIRIADISESSVDPLSRAVRHRLRRDHGIENGIPVVFSTEAPKAKLLPFETPNGENGGNPSDYQIVPGFRVRILPVLGTLPAMFGQAMATYVITRLAGVALSTEPLLHLSSDQYSVLHSRLLEREELRFGSSGEVEVDVEEVAYVVRELWRGRSARDQSRRDIGKGLWRSMANMTLTRWDENQPPSINNLVLLNFQEAEEIESLGLAELSKRDPEFVAATNKVLAQAWADFNN